MTTYKVKDPRIDDHFDEWRVWLNLHGVDIGAVYQMDVSSKYVTVHRFKTNDDGRFYMDGDDEAKEKVRIRMITRPPQYV